MKAEWGSLAHDDLVRISCENTSAESKAHAKADKLAHKEAVTRVAPAVDIGGTTALVSATADDRCERQLPITSFFMLQGGGSDGPGTRESINAVVSASCPLSLASCSRCHLVDQSVDKTVDAWKTLVNKPVHGKEVVTTETDLPSQCKGMCIKHATDRLISLHEFAFNSFHAMVKRAKRPQCLVQAWCKHGDGESKVMFAFVASWSASAGKEPFKCNVVQCVPHMELPGHGAVRSGQTLVRLRRRDYREPQMIDDRSALAFQAPFINNDRVGMFAHMDESEWLAEVLGRGDVDAPHVELAVCESTDVGWDGFLLDRKNYQVGLPVVIDLAAMDAKPARPCTRPSDGVDLLRPLKRRRNADVDRHSKRDNDGDLLFDLEAALGEIIDAEQKRDLEAIRVELDADAHFDDDAAQSGSSDDDIAEEGAVKLAADGATTEDFEPVKNVAEACEFAAEASDEEESGVTEAIGGHSGGSSSSGGRMSPFERRLAAIDSERATTQEEACNKFGLSVGDRWVIKDELNESVCVGRLKLTFGGSTIQCVCNKHPGCKFLLSGKPRLGLGLDRVEADLIGWVALGTRCTKAEHDDAMRRIKRDMYGMKLRS